MVADVSLGMATVMVLVFAISALATCGALVVIEEHSVMGGFGDAVVASLAEQGVQIPVRTLGIPDKLIEHGSQAEWRAELGLDAAGIERAARELIGR